MTGEEMERAIEFLLSHHARVSADIEALKEAQAKTSADIRALTENVSQLGWQMGEMRATVASVIEEMREGFDKLILANEVTRGLAEQAAKLAISANQRVTKLEEKSQ
jgi:hypothetical protein